MAKKGSAEERDLVHKLWERNFAAMRAPASGGATKRPLPDVLAGNGKLYLAIEVKTTTKEKIYIDQVVIGSCTNGRMSDMRKAAAILKGREVAPEVRVMVIPATQKIFVQCMEEGLAKIFVEAGCAFNTPGCGACKGISFP